jgi:hypothetical protein
MSHRTKNKPRIFGNLAEQARAEMSGHIRTRKRIPNPNDIYEHFESSGDPNKRKVELNDRKLAEQYTGVETEYTGENYLESISGIDNVINQYNLPTGSDFLRVKGPMIIKAVADVLSYAKNRRLSSSELHALSSFVNSLPQHKLAGLSDRDIIRNIANRFIETSTEQLCENGTINIREILKETIGIKSEETSYGFNNDSKTNQPVLMGSSVDISSILGKNSKYDIQSIINPMSQLSYSLILLDSKYRKLDTDGTSVLSWNAANSATTSQGTFNYTPNIRDIVSIQTFRFTTPKPTSGDNSYRLISMFITEFVNQGIVAQENRQFQFLFESVVEDNKMMLNPSDILSEGTFYFDSPITRLDSITLTFGSPLEQVIFPKDRMNVTFTYAAVTTIITPESHGLSNGDRISLTGFTTDDIAGDAGVIAAMNRLSGHSVTVLSSTTFTISVNTANITGKTSTFEASCYFMENRMFIPIKIGYIKPKPGTS